VESGPYAAKLNARFKAAGSSASMHARRRRSAASRSRTRSDAFLRSSRAASLDEVEVGDAGEAEAATKGAPIGPTVLCRPRHDVGGDGCEPPPVEIGTNRQPPADTTGIERLQRSDIGERKREPVAVRIPQKPANALRRRLLESDGKVDIPRSARPFRQPHLEGDATLHHPSLGICVHEAGKQALEHDVPSCTLDIETGAAASDVRWPAAAPGRSRTSRSFPFEQLHGSLDRERSGRAERVCAVEEQAPCERLKVRLRGSRHRGPM